MNKFTLGSSCTHLDGEMTDSGYEHVSKFTRNGVNWTALEPLQFRFVQWEHRGGLCDCWAVANLSLILIQSFLPSESHLIPVNESKLCDTKNKSVTNVFHPVLVDQLPSIQEQQIVASFCEDSASMPREFVAQFGPYTLPCDEPTIKDPPTDCSESDLRM